MTSVLPAVKARRALGARFRNAKFDPRLVGVGMAVLAAVAIGGSVLSEQASTKADEVAAPVAELCQQGGAAGAQLADSGACAAADDVAAGTGPYVSTLTGQRGASGATGQRGAVGAPGESIQGPPGESIQGPGGVPGGVGPGGEPGGTGASGEPGTPGESIQGPPGESIQGPPGESIQGPPGPAPACLSEPGQCRGPEGRGIADTQVVGCRLLVTYTDGTGQDAGPVCATDSAPEPEEPATDPTEPTS